MQARKLTTLLSKRSIKPGMVIKMSSKSLKGLKVVDKDTTIPLNEMSFAPYSHKKTATDYSTRNVKAFSRIMFLVQKVTSNGIQVVHRCYKGKSHNANYRISDIIISNKKNDVNVEIL